ncbi:MAG: M20/M25/M40 family metallo-hydrolase [Chloroflexota bacterium]
METVKWDKLAAEVIDLAVAIQQIPAPTFKEGQRAAWVEARFRAENLEDVHRDARGNVLARLPGRAEVAPLILSAHLDTVFPANTDLHVQREADKVYGPGIGDNSLGVAGLFGLVRALRWGSGLDLPLAGDVWLVANVGEEGLGDLVGMRAIVEHFGAQVKAYIILEGLALGQVYHRALGVRRYRIEVTTQGGHSWVDYGRPSAIHEIAALISRLSNLALPPRPRTSLNVGVVSGGTSVNTIAAEAHLELDLRSEGAGALQKLVQTVERQVMQFNHTGVQVRMESIGNRPAGKIPISHPLIQLAQRCLIEQGIAPNLAIGSTDANVPLSLGLPAVCVGLSKGSGAHTLQEYIYTAPVQSGLAQLAALVRGVFQEL